MGSSAPVSLQVSMKFLIVLVGLGLVAAKPQFGKDLRLAEGRIIGGEEAPKHEFPWQVSLKSLGSHICGGSIVNKNQVITAAHCCEGQLALFDRIIAGAHDRNLEAGHQSRAISSMEFHESWNNPAFDHDICLVTVEEPFDFKDPNVQPVDFFKTGDAEIPAETICNSTWWGLTTRRSSPATSRRTWSVPAVLATPPAMETVAVPSCVLMLMGWANLLVLSPSDTLAVPMLGS